MVGKTAKKVGPVVEKGVAGVYGALASGFDLGIKGAKKVSRKMTASKRKSRKTRRH
jgi:hypothetical protein